jgi:putative ABC transport system substrate-binding protein
MTHGDVTRRKLLALPAAMAAWPGSGAQAQPLPRPGVAAPKVVTLSPGPTRTMPAFRSALAELGYPIEVEAFTTELDGARVAAAVAAATAVLAVSPPAIAAARRLTNTVPIVALDLELDPVGSGLVETLARPGGNLTGLFLDQPGIAAKWLQLLAEAVPTLRRLAMLWDTATGPAQRDAVQVAARGLGIQDQTFEIRAGEPEASFAGIRAMQAQGLVLLSSPLVFQNQARLAQMAIAARLPTITMFTDFVSDGGFLAYGPDRADMGRRAAAYVDQIIKGRRAAELPVERPSRFEVAINLRTARALDISVPQTLLARADEVID